MLLVRKNLTEILLEVTNEQINAIANETFRKMRSKGQNTHFTVCHKINIFLSFEFFAIVRLSPTTRRQFPFRFVYRI